MPVKIRLARRGRKKIPFYHIVVADSRAPRDGKYIEKLGKYYPKTNPATIELDFDRALYWLQTGAQPSDTCRSILSVKGVLYKNHLLNGVKKGALTVEQVDGKYQAWFEVKEKKHQIMLDDAKDKNEKLKKLRLEAETKVREDKAAAIASKLAKAATQETSESTESAESAESAETAENTEETK
jgi:small subunit ribosomal protein S16